MTPRPGRILSSVFVLLSIGWSVAQWDWAGMLAGLLHALPLIALAVVVVPLGTGLFLLAALSIPRNGGGR